MLCPTEDGNCLLHTTSQHDFHLPNTRLKAILITGWPVIILQILRSSTLHFI